MDNTSAAHAGLTKLLSASSHPVNNNNNNNNNQPGSNHGSPAHVHSQPPGPVQQQQHPGHHQQHQVYAGHPMDPQQQQPQHPGSYASYNQQPSYPYAFGQAPQYAPRPPYMTNGPPAPYAMYGRGPQQQQQQGGGSPGQQYAAPPQQQQQQQQQYPGSQPHSPVGPYHHQAPPPPPGYGPRYTPYEQGPLGRSAAGPAQHPLASDMGPSSMNDLIGATQFRTDVTLPPPQPSSTTTLLARSNGGTSGNATEDEKGPEWAPANKKKAPRERSSGKAPPEKKFVCPHASCGRAFARNFNLQSHIKSHMGVRDFACPECHKKFSRKHDCTRHCIAIHKYDKDTGKKAVKQTTQQPQQTPAPDFVDNPPAYPPHIPLPPNTLHS